MRPVSIAVAAIAALATVLPASAQDQPSNAELYRMLKDQQKTLSEQQVLIGKLRAELRDSQKVHEQTRKDVRREERRVRHLTAQVKRQTKQATQAHAAFAAGPEDSSFAIEGSYLYLMPALSDTYFAIAGTSAGSARTDTRSPTIPAIRALGVSARPIPTASPAAS